MEAVIHQVVAGGERFSLAVGERRAGPDLVLFIHGIGCTKESFDDAWPAQALQDYSLLTPDLPGYGDSPMPEGFSCRMQDYAVVLRGLLDRCDFQRLHVVAHSMGGAIGLYLAAAGGLPLASFVNVEGNLVAADCSMLSRRAAAIPFETFRDVNLAKLRVAAADSPDPGMRLWAAWAERCDARAFHRCCLSLVETSDSGELFGIYAGLTVPELYVYGERSANADVLGHLGGLARAEVPACGHFVMNEKPGAFHALLADFLSRA